MTIALMLTAAPLAAQAPLPNAGRAVSLAPGEIALHIVAHGETVTPADRIVIVTSVPGKGATPAEARTAADAAVVRLSAALAAMGIDRSAITTSRAANMGSLITYDVIRADARLTGQPVPPPSHTMTIAVTITLRDVASLDQAMAALAAQGLGIEGRPVASLRDDAAARRVAVSAAVAKARAQADSYATALGFRIVRIVAAANTAGLDDGVEGLAAAVGDLDNRNRPVDMVTTRATASVDFALTGAR